MGPRADAKPTVYVTPLVCATAEEHSVDLATVQGTGVGGRITKADVRAAAGLSREPQAAARPRVVAAVRATSSASLKVTMEARWSVLVAQGSGGFFRERATVEIDVFGVNPLADELRAAAPHNFAEARRSTGAEPPTLFTSGDLPIFTTAGFDPANLLRLPWVARHAAARADGSRAGEIFERYGAPTVESWTAAQMAFATDDGNTLYLRRMNAFAEAGAQAERKGSA